MKTAYPFDSNTEFSTKARPSISVRCGESFKVRTELCSGPWLESADTVWQREAEQAGNILSCVEIEDSSAGDVLAVHIQDIALHPLSYTGLEGRGTFPYPGTFLGEHYDDSSLVRIMSLKDGRFFWGDTPFPAAPMIGCIGTARPDTAPGKDIPHRCGGNLDVRDVKTGSCIYLPVLTDKAYLFVGDSHARQGDGEICGWGAECRSELELRVEKAALFPFEITNAVLAEDSRRIMAFGFGQGFEEAYKASVSALLEFAAFRSGREKRESYVRLGLAMESYVAQSCFPQWPVFVSAISKEFL